MLHQIVNGRTITHYHWNTYIVASMRYYPGGRVISLIEGRSQTNAPHASTEIDSVLARYTNQRIEVSHNVLGRSLHTTVKEPVKYLNKAILEGMSYIDPIILPSHTRY